MIVLKENELPAVLVPVSNLLSNGIGPVRSSGPWCRWTTGDFSIRISVDVDVDAGQIFPTKSDWHIVLSTNTFPARIDVFPDKENGVAVTFPHQEAVETNSGLKPWKEGKPCLGDPSDALGDRHGAGNKPVVLEERLIWLVRRFADWCVDAAAGTLHKIGDPYELPPLPGAVNSRVVGFHETEESYQIWQGFSNRCGTANLVEISSPAIGFAVKSWHTLEGDFLYEPPWGDMIANASEAGLPCLWVRLNELPVTEAWQLPRNFRDISKVLRDEGIDLADIFAALGRSMRNGNVRHPACLMLGFPIPKKFGDTAKRHHWLSIYGIPISKKTTVRAGFRDLERNRVIFDRDLAESTKSINWSFCENWASDQVRTRLRTEADMPSVLVIGAGSLGSQVSETLVRMGVTEIGVIDADRLTTGNLCRHSLSMSSIGKKKASELAVRLNSLQPDVRAKAFDVSLPLIGNEGLCAPAHHDIIVDCTGEDDVLRSLAAIPWQEEVTFVSLSMSWGAAGLLVWSSRGTAFPALDASSRLRSLLPQKEHEMRDGRIEGIGCWHPVFPADAADVQVWAGIGARFVLRMVEKFEDCCGIYRFEAHGTIGFKNG